VATVASIAATFRVNDLLPRELQQTLNSLAVNFSTSSAVENNRTIIFRHFTVNADDFRHFTVNADNFRHFSARPKFFEIFKFSTKVGRQT
jgi:hypothetical protein